jgi:alpha-glucosidase
MSQAVWEHRIIALMMLLAAGAGPVGAAGSAVRFSPYPVVAGEPVVVQYDPAGRVLQGALQVYLHYGFNKWNPVMSDVPMSWNAGASVWEATVTAAALATQLDVVFHNGSGTWDDHERADWHAFVVGGQRWIIDGQLDEKAVLVAESGPRQLYAGVRGTVLYVAAPGARDGNDHFVFVADSPGSLRNAPWAKSGRVARWSAYIGNEVDSGWIGWFDADGAGEVATGTWMEGTLDLVAEFGSMPGSIHLAFAPYDTPDGGALRYALQVPASTDNDGDVQASEYVQVSIASIRVACSALDLDRDCDVDTDDLVVFLGCMNGPGTAGCPDADFDSDGDVDLADYAYFQAAFGRVIVPEPVVAEDLGANATRFYPGSVTLGELPPSMSMETDPVVYGLSDPPWAIQPQFFASGGRHVVWIPIDDDIHLYGTGEICGKLLRSGHTTEAWNTDAYGYGPWNESLYQSHPWVLAVRPDGTAFGVLADTTFRCKMDLSMDILFAAEGPAFPLYLFEGDSPQDVLVRLTDFIGRMELPPLWSLGYHQSRYSYAPESYARWIANEFRSRSIPCDVIWFDIDYMNGYRIFTFDPYGFPNPLALNSDLHAMGYHTTWMIDPGVKAESGYFVSDQGSAGDHWVYKATGGWYTGEVWPGACYFPDYTRPQTRDWWAGLYGAFMAQGIDGVWNDMNEPGIFDGPNHSMPLDCWHRGGGGLPAGPHYQYHNVYGMLMSQASRDGILAAKPDKRPFVLSRASFIGGHRVAAMWTGDNIANWDHLYHSTPMVLNIGLSGQPFAGPDLGGYGGDAWGDLFARWMGVGVFMPFCRGHYDGYGVDQEPWSFGPAVEAVCRTAIERRYRLLPYIYTLFEEASRTGLPVARPVFFADPADLALRQEDVAFLLGSDVLVVPNVSENPGSAPTPALPGGIWRTISLVGENSATDVNQPDLRVRGGAIVPVGPVMQYTNEAPLDPLTLVVSLDGSGQAEGWLYEDSGEGFDYLTGDYRHARYTAVQAGNTVTVAVAEVSGQMGTPSRQVMIEIVTDGGVVSGAGTDNDGGVIAVIPLP